MSKKLSDLFVVYRPKEIKSEKVSKEVYLPEGVYNWQNFLDNIERVQKSKFGQETPETKVEVVEETPFIFDWNTVPIQEYNDLWGFQPEYTGESYLGAMQVTTDDNGQSMTQVTSPLEVARVKKARLDSPANYKTFKLLMQRYKNNYSGDLTQEDWDMLEGIAGIESDYDITKESSSGALGWFQIMPSNIEHYGVNIEDFKKDPNLQFQVAIKLYKNNKRQLANYLNLIKAKKLTPFQATYMYWWGPEATKTYLKSNYSSIQDSDNNDIFSIMKKAS